MPRNPAPLTRRSILLLLTGAVVALSGVGFGPRLAYADEAGEDEDDDDGDDGDNSGPGGGDDNGEVDADNSGETGGDEDGDDDGGGGDDNSGHGGGNDHDGGETPSSGQSGTRVRNVTVRYSDGWTELILNGQYQLIDNLNRQVILRRATIEDFNRMVALGS